MGPAQGRRTLADLSPYRVYQLATSVTPRKVKVPFLYQFTQARTAEPRSKHRRGKRRRLERISVIVLSAAVLSVIVLSATIFPTLQPPPEYLTIYHNFFLFYRLDTGTRIEGHSLA